MAEGCEITDTHGYLVQVFLGVLCFLILICTHQQETQRKTQKIMEDMDISNISKINKQEFKIYYNTNRIIQNKEYLPQLHIYQMQYWQQHQVEILNQIHVTVKDFMQINTEVIEQCNQIEDYIKGIYFILKHIIQQFKRYFVTILFDTTLGVFICFIILTIFEKIFDRYNLVQGTQIFIFFLQKSIRNSKLETILNNQINQKRTQSGSEVDESNSQLLKPIVKISYIVWLYQLLLWNLIVVLSKLLLYGIQSSISNFLQPLINWMFSWLEEEKNLRLILVMMIIPSVLNSIQFWIQDNILKKSDFSSMEKEYVACQIYESDDLNDLRKSEAARLELAQSIPMANSSPYNGSEQQY